MLKFQMRYLLHLRARHDDEKGQKHKWKRRRSYTVDGNVILVQSNTHSHGPGVCHFNFSSALILRFSLVCIIFPHICIVISIAMGLI